MQTKMAPTLEDVYAGMANLSDVPGYISCPLNSGLVISSDTCKAYQDRPRSTRWADGDPVFRADCPDSCRSPHHKHQKREKSKSRRPDLDHKWMDKDKSVT